MQATGQARTLLSAGSERWGPAPAFTVTQRLHTASHAGGQHAEGQHSGGQHSGGQHVVHAHAVPIKNLSLRGTP